MRQPILSLCWVLLSCCAQAQQRDIWTAFPNKDTTLTGFKDATGKVRITPRFTAATVARRFEHIMAASEEPPGGGWKNYYLTKSGRIVGVDSLFISDNSGDCESEGFIRFHDPVTDKIGMFNRNGDIAIPPVYSAMTQVSNGMVVVLKDATKRVWEGGEHFSWEGGYEMLADTANHILIDSFRYDDVIDFYSVRRSAAPETDSIRKSFKGTDGQYYSFIDTDKEFKAWLHALFAGTLTRERLTAATDSEVIYMEEDWKRKPGAQFIADNFGIIQAKLSKQAIAGDMDSIIINTDADFYLSQSPHWQRYFDNCDRALARYPFKLIVISGHGPDGDYQDHFGFLRTSGGYKLVYVTLEKGALK